MTLTDDERSALLKFWPKSRFNPGADEPYLEFDLYGILRFCGCGDPDAAAKWLLRLLVLMDSDPRDLPAIEAHWGATLDTPAYYLILYYLDAEGWTEHGGNVCGSWLTDKGRAGMIALREFREDVP